MWDNGGPANNQVLTAFDDTIGYCSVRGRQWRYNTMFRTNDRPLSKQVINSIKFVPAETGIIPTSGISVGTTQYMNFMSIRSWDSSGSWTTNFSAIAVSPDNGEHWDVYPRSVRPASPDATPRVPYVSGVRILNWGRSQAQRRIPLFVRNTFRAWRTRVRVARPARIGARAVAVRVLGRRQLGPQQLGSRAAGVCHPVGEMSVQDNTYLKQFLALYCSGNNDVGATGPWGPEQILVSSNDFPGGIYAPYLHPWSTGKRGVLQPVAVVRLQRDADEDGLPQPEFNRCVEVDCPTVGRGCRLDAAPCLWIGCGHHGSHLQATQLVYWTSSVAQRPRFRHG